MTHEQIVNKAWAAYLTGKSFVAEFRRLWTEKYMRAAIAAQK